MDDLSAIEPEPTSPDGEAGFCVCSESKRVVVRGILITHCTDPLMWYANRLGEIVPFVRSDEEHYWSREDAGYLNIVHKKDAMLVYS